MANTVKLHQNIQTLKQDWQQEEQHGVYISDYEKLYHFNLLYAEACSCYHYLEAMRKDIKDKLILEFKNEVKTDKMAEAMARTSSEHRKIVEDICIAEKYYLQLRAEIGYLQGKMEAEKSREISQNIEKRLSASNGEGKY